MSKDVAVKETESCPRCGYENPKDAMNCQNCRVNLKWARQHAKEFERERRGIQELQRREKELREQLITGNIPWRRERPWLKAWEYKILVILPPGSIEFPPLSLQTLLETEEPVVISWDALSEILAALGTWGWELISVMPVAGAKEKSRIGPIILSAILRVPLISTDVALTTEYFVGILKRPTAPVASEA